MKKATDDMDAGLNNLNMEVQQLRKKIDENEKEIKLTNDRCLYQEVYNRRENLRFLAASLKRLAPKKLQVKLCLRF